MQESVNELQTVPSVRQLTRQIQKAWIMDVQECKKYCKK